MAVEKRPSMVREYWPRFRKRSVLILVLSQILLTLIAGCGIMAVEMTGVSYGFWIMVGIILAASLGINFMLFTVLSSPLEDLTSALTHAAGEPTDTVPPNPNVQRFERDGFKPLLQLIYELASNDKTIDTQHASESITDLSTALDNTAAGFVIMDTKKHISYHNDKAPVHGTADGTMILNLMFEDEDTLDLWLKQCEESAVHAERTWQRVSDKVVGEEDRKIYDVTASYQKGSSAEVVITLFDRTAMYLPEDEDLDFIAFAAHELRGPITVIRGYLDVLSDELDTKLKDDQIELMKRLVVSANRLSSYVNNILNASRYDRRHLKMHLKEDSISEIYDTISDDMQLRASSQNRMLSVTFPDDLPMVAADRASISEVISNLVDNAIKYSNEGGIVSVTAHVDGDFVKVSVEDHGIGMPGNVVSNLFHKFYRSHRSRETVAGTGIGLYICKAIIESHGGKVGVRSVEHEGSTFDFSLPIYSTVAEKLRAHNNSNEGLIEHNETGWIKNHAMYRG
jgi:two-component system phosphate regulon sensor histidine kinase PhoR/two-component system sensor histidine kinase VicK